MPVIHDGIINTVDALTLEPITIHIDCIDNGEKTYCVETIDGTYETPEEVHDASEENMIHMDKNYNIFCLFKDGAKELINGLITALEKGGDCD